MAERHGPVRHVEAGHEAAPSGRASSSQYPKWPIVGRGRLLRRADELLGANALTGMVVSGAAGIGKTSVVTEVVALGRRRGLATEHLVGTAPAGGISLGALAPVVPSPTGPSTTEFDRLRLAIETLRARAGADGLLLAVDNAQFLDELSSALLCQLAAVESVFVVAAVRSAERLPDSIVGMTRERLAEHIPLGALDEPHVAELLVQALDGPIEASTVRRLWSASAGVPLYIRALVEGGLATQNLRRSEGRWRWEGSFLVPAVHDAVHHRLADLSKRQRDALELIALAEEASVTMAAAAADAETLSSLEGTGLLRAYRDGRRQTIRVAHPLVTEVLQATIPPLRAQSIRGRLASVLEELGTRRGEDLIRIATWRLETGGSVPAGELLRAARHARRSGSFAVAEGLARAAMERGGGVASRIELAHVLAGAGQHVEAERLLAGAVSEAGEDAHCKLAELRAQNLFWAQERPADAEQVLVDAERLVGPVDLRDRLRSSRGLYAYLQGRPQEALDTLWPVLTRPDVDQGTLAQGLLRAAPAWAVLGKTDQALTALERLDGLAGAGAAAASAPAADRQAQRAFVLTAAGDLKAAEREALNGYHTVVRAGDEQLRGLLALTVGRAVLGQGRAREAAGWLTDASALLRDVDAAWVAGGFLPWCLAELARARALDRDRFGAREALAECEQRLRGPARIVQPSVVRARGWTHVAAGKADRGRALLLEAADVAAEVGHAPIEAAALYDAALVGQADDVAGRLHELAGTVQSPLVDACAAHLRASAGDDTAGLTEAAERLESAGALLAASMAWADAAASYQGRRTAGKGSDAHVQSARLLHRCGLRRLPGARVARGSLTPREREVAALAARQLPSSAIAEQLVVSVRTVENHLYRAYSKLGIRGRGELAQLFNGIA